MARLRGISAIPYVGSDGVPRAKERSTKSAYRRLVARSGAPNTPARNGCTTESISSLLRT